MSLSATAVRPGRRTPLAPRNGREPREPSTVIEVPILRPAILDEREFCPIVHDVAVAGSPRPPYPPECPKLRSNGRADYCARMGPNTPCALADPASPVWRKARQWRRLPGGSLLYVGTRTPEEIAALLASLEAQS